MGARSPCSTQMKIVLIWGIVGLISKVDTAYLQLTCPSVFNEGSNVITCSVNQTLFNSACPDPFSIVQFTYKRPNATTQVRECETPIVQSPNTCPSAASKGVNSNSTCLCSQRNGNMATYELHFIGSNTQHEGITFQCIICLSQSAVDQNNSASCSNIKFGGSLDGNGSGPPAWIAAPIILGSAGIIGIIFIIIFHCALGCKLCGKKGSVPCCKKTDTPVSKCVKYVSCEQNSCSKTKPSIRKP